MTIGEKNALKNKKSGIEGQSLTVIIMTKSQNQSIIGTDNTY